MKVADVAGYLRVHFYGENFPVYGICSLKNPKEQHLAFCKHDDVEGRIPKLKMVVLVSRFPTDMEDHPATFIVTENPRYVHAVLTKLFFETHIGFTVYDGATLYDCVRHGTGCRFGHGTVVGQPGFGPEWSFEGIPILRPQMGGVQIGNFVEIGCNSTIARGTIDDTIIGDNVKIDDRVHVAHNCVIGDNTIVVAGTSIGGSATIGKNCWLGINCTIKNQTKIGDNVTIGIGANIVKDVPSGTVMAGFMSRPLAELRAK